MKKSTEIFFVFLLVAFVLVGVNAPLAIIEFAEKSNQAGNQCYDLDTYICWVDAANTTKNTIFNFSVFLTSMALLVVLYSILDDRFQFRILTCPVHLKKITFASMIIIGFGILVNDLWFSYGFPIPKTLNNQALWQSAFGAAFFIVVTLWFVFGFVAPPRFSKHNYRKVSSVLFNYVLEGDDKKLKSISAEIIRMIGDIIKFAKSEISEKEHNGIHHHASEILLLLGNRNYCKVAAKEPRLAMEIFYQMSRQKKKGLPVSQFAVNFLTESIRNKNSILYHEDNGYRSGLIGYIKPLTKEVFENYHLINSLDISPLEIGYQDFQKWDADQFEVYLNCVIAAFKGYMKQTGGNGQSRMLRRAFDIIAANLNPFLFIEKNTDTYTDDLFFQKGMRCETFICNLIEIIENADRKPYYKLRNTGKYSFDDRNLYGLIAEFIFNIGEKYSYVDKPADRCWTFQHNIFWRILFSYGTPNETEKILQFKVRRLFYNAIMEIDKHPNYVNARLLGMCLNLTGLKQDRVKISGKNDTPLRIALLSYCQRNLYKIVNNYPELVEVLTPGNLSFAENNTELHKTYSKWLGEKEAARDVLKLDHEPYS